MEHERTSHMLSGVGYGIADRRKVFRFIVGFIAIDRMGNDGDNPTCYIMLIADESSHFKNDCSFLSPVGALIVFHEHSESDRRDVLSVP